MSTPGHENYGKHFQSHDEMKQLLLPSDEAVKSVTDWLQAAGVQNIQHDADWINAETTVDTAEKLLGTKYGWYANEVRDIRRLRTLEYSVPDALSKHINMIQPTTRFGQIHPEGDNQVPVDEEVAAKYRGDAALSKGDNTDIFNCDKYITPQCLKDLYRTEHYHADPSRGSKLSFSSYLEEYARYDDLELFEEKIAPYAKGENFSVITYNGGVNDQDSSSDSGEANLDCQYLVGVGSPLPLTEYITGGRGKLIPDLSEPGPKNSNEPYLAFLQSVLKRDQDDLPQVLSTSYGEDEQVSISQI